MLLSYWQIPVALNLVVAYILCPYLLKDVVSRHSRTKRFFLQYIFAFAISVIFALILGHLAINTTVGIMTVLGCFNGFAAYCHWRAVDISLSKNSLFTFWDDLIGMVLGITVLQEIQILTGGLILGIVLSIGANILFVFYSYQKMRSGKSEITGTLFYVYVVFYSVVWGVANFATRYFGLQHIPVGQFLTGWYGGALLAALYLFCFYDDKSSSVQQQKAKLTSKDIFWVFVLSLSIMSSMGFYYWAYLLAPLNVVQPIFLVAEMVLPTMVGLLWFKEIRETDKVERILFVVGIIGGIIIAFNY